MDIIIFLVFFAVIAYLAYWVITKFFADPIQMPALAITGLVLLWVLYEKFSGAHTFFLR